MENEEGRAESTSRGVAYEIEKEVTYAFEQ